MTEEEANLRLQASIAGLADREPMVSAKRILTDRQRRWGVALIALILIGCVMDLRATLSALVCIITLLYVGAIIYRLVLFRASNQPHTTEVVSDEEARAVPHDQLPIYTVMIPAYHEPEVISELIRRVSQFEYPPDRLDVKLLIEADDVATIEAIDEAMPGDQFELVLVPAAEPRTKPKALNYGLTLARGELVAIYDAEDEPEPLQLRRAVVAMSRLGPDVACVQAKLDYHNPDAEPHHQVVHHRVLLVVLLLPSRPGVDACPHTARRDVQPLPPGGPPGSRGLGSLQRHRGRRSRDPDVP